MGGCLRVILKTQINHLRGRLPVGGNRGCDVLECRPDVRGECERRRILEIGLERREMLNFRGFDIGRFLGFPGDAGIQCCQHIRAQGIVHHVCFEMIAHRAQFDIHVGQRFRLPILSDIAAEAHRQHAANT